MNIIDKLYKRVAERGVVCLGLDTALEYIPEGLLKGKSIKERLLEFNKRIIDKTEDVVSCYKVQIAYYEALGIEGLLAYKETLEYLRKRDLIVIADIKRGDISDTAGMYAKAHFEGDFEADFITVNPYMGMDSIEPYMEYINSCKKGIFSLVRTSNPGAKDIEMLKTEDGREVYKVVGDNLASFGEKSIGECGYSGIGGVIGCTHVEDGIEIRNRFKNMFFLIPGYGAQGGKAEDVALYLNKGNGGVVNSSRRIILAYKKENRELDFDICAREEAIRMRDEIKAAISKTLV